MSESERGQKVYSPKLTWKEENPFSYRFNNKVITRLEKVTEQVRKENGIKHKDKNH